MSENSTSKCLACGWVGSYKTLCPNCGDIWSLAVPAGSATPDQDVITAASKLAKVMSEASNDRYGTETIMALLRLEETLRRVTPNNKLRHGGENQ